MKKKSSMVGDMMSVGIGNLVGVGMISATSGMVAGLPAGTAKDIAGVVPGLQSAALVGHNLKLVKSSLKTNGKSKNGKSKGYW